MSRRSCLPRHRGASALLIATAWVVTTLAVVPPGAEAADQPEAARDEVLVAQFADVPPEHPFFAAIEWLAHEGIAQVAVTARQGVSVLGPGAAATRLENIARFSDFISESMMRAAEQVRDLLHAS